MEQPHLILKECMSAADYAAWCEYREYTAKTFFIVTLGLYMCLAFLAGFGFAYLNGWV